MPVNNWGAFSSEMEENNDSLGLEMMRIAETQGQNIVQKWEWQGQINADQLCQLQLFATAVHNTGDAIVITTSNLEPPGPEIVYVNRAFTQITGYFAEDVLGQTPRILQGPKTDRQVLETMKCSLQERKVFQGETINYRKDGTEFHNHWRVEPICSASGQITHYLAIQRDITHQKQSEHLLTACETSDPLTRLPNRSILTYRLQEAIEKTHCHQDYLFALLFLDLDHFKLVNDSLGHQAGDQLLVAIAQRLQQCVRPTDMIARLGGDEFAILLNNIRDLATVSQIAERIQQNLRKTLLLKGHELSTTVSIGIALSSTGYDHPEDLLRDADIALHRAKARGRACYAVFNKTMHLRVLERLHLENDLRRAVDTQQLQLHYQPIVSIKTGRIAGFEALLRWYHPQRGAIPPAQFIPVAEETGLIQEIGEWVLRTACKRAGVWDQMFPNSSPLFMSVNLSSQQLTQINLVETIAQILAETRCDPNRLKLEITESAITEKADMAISTLKELKALGIRLCIDDFGTGYSSLSRLYSFPISTLKIDRSFVSGIDLADGTTKIVEAIIALGQNLGMEVIAEGVETEQQLHVLRRLNCQYAQGYWFARPTTYQEVEALLTSQPWL
ncbi:MAG: putative bifunctional diguanylate cyclase/phosphodiesterase [Microcoleaceae cyanobacterium]